MYSLFSSWPCVLFPNSRFFLFVHLNHLALLSCFVAHPNSYHSHLVKFQLQLLNEYTFPLSLVMFLLIFPSTVDFSSPCFFLGPYVVGSFWASLLIYSVTVATVLMFLVVLVGIQL
ncbi:hypothetical protein DFH05DRAFT_1504424 [Lentinula detonsa]|uniref:Uncharacterized protein n=1 Tax=Lentinula detonsa TaxID=2804962 RepID=A0A9W8NWT9_9AGAR|nr:hypothetical protein DFH05DRAFT_1504424 [Lentinula detonsa]